MAAPVVPAPTFSALEQCCDGESRGVVTKVDPNADHTLMKRFADCPHSTISALIAAGNGAELPKHGANPVCLTWALKGSCSSGCKRKAMHVRYSRVTIQKVNEFLDTCGVAPQAS